MCDVQTKLVAWLDGELSTEEAADVKRHVGSCEECRSQIGAYERVRETFGAYCDAVVAAKIQPRVPRWVPVLACAAVAATVLFAEFPRNRVEPPPILTPMITTAAVSHPARALPEPAPRKTTVPRRHAVAPVEVRTANWQPTEPAVQIAIPAEAMFAPGAMPKGMNFVAELSIAPDGSVRQVRLRQ